MLTAKIVKIREESLQCVPNIITNEKNLELERIPTLEELRRVVMHMHQNSAPGLDGIGGKF